MVKTFLIDLPVLALFGALFALFTRREDASRSPFHSPYLWHGVVFSSLFNAVVLYSYFKYPDWMWMYFVEGLTLSSVELIYIFLFIYYVPYVAGFVVGRNLVRRSLAAGWGLILFLAAWEVWIVWHLFDRYSVIGTTKDYLGGTAIPMFSPENPIGLATNLTLGAMALYFLFVLWRHRRSVSKIPAESEF